MAVLKRGFASSAKTIRREALSEQAGVSETASRELSCITAKIYPSRASGLAPHQGSSDGLQNFTFQATSGMLELGFKSDDIESEEGQVAHL